ncbi:PucR family transcriptional regulator [Streptomyces sp. NPDC016845]|uniref:PucR family transcriptional regulator n=1 Tax=Streptomyces sp. NPDC016845 TaxID=3364972 RepID=UPI00378B2445
MITGSAPGDVTLRQLLAYDDDGILRLTLAPAGQDVVVRGLVIGDESAGRPHDGRVVLVVGPGTDAGATACAVRQAARRGATAVVVRGRGDEPLSGEVVAAGRETGIAVLERAEWADWADTVELLRSALAFAAAGAGDRLAGDIAGGGLAVLAQEVARYCRASITVEDTQFRLLAHSATSSAADPERTSTILGGKVPDRRVARLRSSGLLRSLWTSRDVIHRPADGDDPERLVVAIRSGAEMLGSIWAAADGSSFSPDAEEALRRAADVAVPHLLQHRLRTAVNRRREEHALRGLLCGEGDVDSHLWSLGLAPETPCAVVVAERDHPSDGATERSLQALWLQATAHRPDVRVLRESDRITVLLPLPDGAEREALGLARELDSLATALPDAPAVWIGAGHVVPTPLDAADSCERARLVVRAVRARAARDPDPSAPPARYAVHADVAHTVTGLRVLDAVRPLWRRHGGPVHDLFGADLAAGGELVRSLSAYLDAGGDVPRAAQRLVLHPNTLRYRLRRARERFGIDLDDPDTRLVVTLAVRLADTDTDTGTDGGRAP